MHKTTRRRSSALLRISAIVLGALVLALLGILKTPLLAHASSGPGAGYYFIQNLTSGKVLDDTDGSTSDGTLVQQYTLYSGNTNQEWSLVYAGGGYYYIINRHSGLALDDTNGDTTNGTQVQLWTQYSGNTNQEWSLVYAGGGYYYIINRHSGLALDDTGGSTSNGTIMQLWKQYNGNTNQEWRFQQVIQVTPVSS